MGTPELTQAARSFVADGPMALTKFLSETPLFLSLQERLGHRFSRPELLLEALTHSSFANEMVIQQWGHYQRLEFLGDMVVGLAVSVQLVDLFPEMGEGELSRMRSALVNQKGLAELAHDAELWECLLLGKGQSQCSGMGLESLLSDVLEAVVGAVVVDANFEVAKASFARLIDIHEQRSGKKYYDPKREELFDPKSRLQELTMKHWREIPRYVSTEIAPGQFEVVLEISGNEVAREIGDSKKRLERSLAKKAIEEELYQQNNN
jgi:ribonuclease-3